MKTYNICNIIIFFKSFGYILYYNYFYITLILQNIDVEQDHDSIMHYTNSN